MSKVQAQLGDSGGGGGVGRVLEPCRGKASGTALKGEECSLKLKFKSTLLICSSY